MNVFEALQEAALITGSMAEARTLLAHVLGCSLSELLPSVEVDDLVRSRLAELTELRAAGLPIQYLTGVAYFRNISVAVGPGVFIPRPETEVMVGWLIDQLPQQAGTSDEQPVIVEFCAGSGAISKAIALERPGNRQYAVEIDEAAFAYAKRNLADTNVTLILGDMATALPELNHQVQVVVANPPYVPRVRGHEVAIDVLTHEPDIAVFSADDGLAAIRVLIESAKRLLAPLGLLIFEHDDSHGDSVPALLKAHGGFTDVLDHPDLTGRARFATAVALSNS